MNERSPLSDLASRLLAQMLPVSYFLVTVSFYLKTYDSAQIKITLTQIGCAVTALLWIIQLVLEKRWPVSRETWPVAAPFLAMLASGMFSFAHASFPAGCLDESVRRVLYALMGLIALSEFRGWDRQRRLLRWLVAAFAVVVFYGFIQYLDTRLFPPGPPDVGLDKFVWRHAFGARVFSSFGNPNFYGNFLVIVTPILLAVYMRNGGQIFRPYLLLPVLAAAVVLADKVWLGSFGGTDAASWPWMAALLAASAAGAAALIFIRTPTGAAAGMLLFFGVMFINLYATETKGAWVGFVGAMTGISILAGLYLAGEGGRRFTRRLLIVTAVMAVLGIGVVAHYARQRFQSVSFRVFTWISTWEMIRTQPLLGTGIGSFKWAYPAFRRPEIILIEGKSNTETDHAEDEYLEVWSDEGLLGFGLFLWLILSVSWLGLRTLNALTSASLRGPPEKERIYTLVGYLGAWWGALLHWSMDVSVRFVSSGIYSLLLPALVASLCARDKLVERQDAPSPADRWARAGVALFWTAVFVSLKRYYASTPLLQQAWPPLLLGFLLWALGELLEKNLAARPSEPAAAPRGRVSLVPAALSLLLLVVGARIFVFARNGFVADLNHNIAIFFSKGGIWSRGPEFDGQAATLPPEMREEYARIGGALEHYEEVVRLNPHFPMAGYFIGNVYSDWGSIQYTRSSQARAQGKEAEAEAFLEKARAYWDLSLRAYDAVKAFAPNYVQTHHQVGTIYLKRMEVENALGRPDKAREEGDKALHHYGLYHTLDPVFPPNYYRMAYIHILRGDADKAEAAYKDALAYNTANVINRLYPDRNVETYVNLGRLYLHEIEKAAPGPSKDALGRKAVDAFEAALVEGGKAGDSPEISRFVLDAHKALGMLYMRSGRGDLSITHWTRVKAMNPQDPDLLRATVSR